jgi:glycosyltransferase involved in cell wall biosynthesis
VPWIKSYDKLLSEIKKRNKVSIFAVDDLVIDTKYTDNIPAVKRMASVDRAVYDDGVNRHKKLMINCDYAITTTNTLARELENYKNFKEIYIDRNSVSEEMLYYSNRAVEEVEKDKNKIIIGYFSGTNTHDEDFRLILDSILKILSKYKNVYIKLTGRLKIPAELKNYSNRLIFTPYVDWRRLPYELRKCDLVLAPLVDNLFNRAKSEIKWSEAALVGVPVIASDVGSFHDSIKNNETGILVENNTDMWYSAIRSLIKDPDIREKIAKKARRYIATHYITTGERAVNLTKFIRSVTPKVIAFAGVNLGAISGGNLVIKKHMDILRKEGNIVYGVETMDYLDRDKWEKLNFNDDLKYDILRINSRRTNERSSLLIHFDKYVATFWSSVSTVDEYKYMNTNGDKLYLVQNMEADFYPLNNKIRQVVIATYRNDHLKPITISSWCKKWLKKDFNRMAKSAQNGIDLKNFKFTKRNWEKRKIKILIEGNSKSEPKRVDESFKITNKLNRDKFEINYLSYDGEPKDWYKVDRVFLSVPYLEIGKIYSSCDILLKSSILESFSYPPLEMMATGGVVIAVSNGGNKEYLRDQYNCLLYKSGSIEGALDSIDKIVNNNNLRNKLIKNGLITAKSYKWENKKQKIISLYE